MLDLLLGKERPSERFPESDNTELEATQRSGRKPIVRPDYEMIRVGCLVVFFAASRRVFLSNS